MRQLLLDTNVFLFYLAVQVDLSIVDHFKRVSQFRRSDLKLLQDLVDGFASLVTTPHVLAEASNLIDQAPMRWRAALIDALRIFAEEQHEIYRPAKELVSRAEFKELALADTGLVDLSGASVTVVTLDYHLYQRIRSAGGEAVHFEHLRYVSSSGKR